MTNQYYTVNYSNNTSDDFLINGNYYCKFPTTSVGTSYYYSNYSAMDNFLAIRSSYLECAEECKHCGEKMVIINNKAVCYSCRVKDAFVVYDIVRRKGIG